MPTFKQAAFIRRALDSIRRQTLADWELIILDDGSPDDTRATITPRLADHRIRYTRFERNRGLGTMLNIGTTMARGRYVAYLPSDDAYFPDHLTRVVGALEGNPETYLAYGGVQWGYAYRGATLLGDDVVGREREILSERRIVFPQGLTSGNILALVQVAHKRDLDGEVRWTERTEIVSDSLEADFWQHLLDRGRRFAYVGAVTTEYVDHHDQRHKIIAGYGMPLGAGSARPPGGLPPHGGLSRYRAHYGIRRREYLNFRPAARGYPIDERARYRRFDRRRPRHRDGLRILLAGELGFNPERILSFEERGHELLGLWVDHPAVWDTTGPLSFGSVRDLRAGRNMVHDIRDARPDVIYGLLNWPAIPLLSDVLDANLDIPLIFHFKEGTTFAQMGGLWPDLVRVLTGADGIVFINEENREWYAHALDGAIDPSRTLILDGDLPKADWMTDDWQPKLSALDGEVHTVCTGRPMGVDFVDELAKLGIHLHVYGRNFWIEEQPDQQALRRAAAVSRWVHLHDEVEPQDWVRELSRYDAGWLHVFESHNGGDLMSNHHWNDLNLPARLGTYATAGLPWILRDNRAYGRVAVERIARALDLGILFTSPEHLREQLAEARLRDQLTANARATRSAFAFDSHVDTLIDFMKATIADRKGRRTIKAKDSAH